MILEHLKLQQLILNSKMNGIFLVENAFGSIPKYLFAMIEYSRQIAFSKITLANKQLFIILWSRIVPTIPENLFSVLSGYYIPTNIIHHHF